MRASTFGHALRGTGYDVGCDYMPLYTDENGK